MPRERQRSRVLCDDDLRFLDSYSLGKIEAFPLFTIPHTLICLTGQAMTFQVAATL